MFPKAFFPALGSTAGTVASFATFAVAFIARPIGAVGFGHYGDRIGRKRTLIATLLLIGIATVLIGLLPGAATIGIAAPLSLIALRFIQGFALGGEWAGATLLIAEYAPPDRGPAPPANDAHSRTGGVHSGAARDPARRRHPHNRVRPVLHRHDLPHQLRHEPNRRSAEPDTTPEPAPATTWPASWAAPCHH